MPRTSERTQLADALHRAFLVNRIAQDEIQLLQRLDEDSSDSDSSDSDTEQVSGEPASDSSSSSSESEEEEDEIENMILGDSSATSTLDLLGELYSSHYLQERREIPKVDQLMSLILDVYKVERPEIFRSYMRVEPETFDALLAAIRNDPVFTNSSNNEQAPIEQQLVVALYRFGHFGNAASTLKAAIQFGIGYGTVRLFTRRVLAATCTDAFRKSAVHWSSPEEKERAKQWVEEQSCPAWRDGWCMVDGTLVPLFQRPELFGSSFFDRKCNYSLNVQIVNTPDLRPIDFGVGLPGSQHDSVAWEETRIPQEHAVLLPDREWVWGDSAYPLKTWCQAPYIKPESKQPENAHFNYHVSKVRIQSEHCMGYVKGRFCSLRGLRVHIRNTESLKIALLWVTACILIHSFAMEHERGHHYSTDEFYRLGVAAERKDREDMERWRVETGQDNDENMEIDEEDHDEELLRGRIRRGELKRELDDFQQYGDM